VLADVNEATLFRHFPRKVDIFRAATESRLGRIRMCRELQSSLADDAELHVVVPQLLHFLVTEIFKQTELMRLMFVAGFEAPNGEDVLREHLGSIFDTLYGYFQRCSAKGMLGEVEPSIATLGIAAVAGAHQTLYQLLSGKTLDWQSEQATKAYMNFLLPAFGAVPGVALKGAPQREDAVEI